MPATFIFFILIASFSTHGVAEADPCFTRCRKGEPWVHFPFRLMDRQSLNCGYPDPALVLYCNDRNETTLHLPSAVSLRVKKIEYVTQQLLLYDPQACLPETLQQLNLSPSSFRFLDGLYTNDFVLFNCSKGNRGDGSQSLVKSCSRYPRDEIYAVSVDSYMDSLSLISCTSMHTISSVPVSIFDKNDISLTWSAPACGSFCKAQGKICMAPPPGDATMEFQCVKVHKGNKKGRLISGLVVGCMFLVILIGAVIFLIISFIKDRENRKKIEGFLEDYKALKPTRFSYADIRRITNQFSEKLGEGGYGVVYKGRLSAEISVAVKVLNNSKENGEEFVNEVSTMGRIHHVNVVRLVGFCAEGFRRVLVYEFLPNESLEKFIFQAESKRSSLGWEKLYNIALGIAKGIEYLHQGCDQQILHFDIKPHNILLDHNFSPKISDFGLAKLCSKEQSAVTMTAARGTMGYIAPELLSRTFGRVSYKSDVYSFGMLLLEMVGGRKNVDKEADKNSQVYFPQWIYSHLNLGDDIWEHIEENRQQLEGEGESENQIKDSPMADCGRNIVRKLTIVGLHCIQWYPADRPSMSAVVVMLEGDGSDLTMPPNPFPNTNATYLVAAIPQTPFQIYLPLILEE